MSDNEIKGGETPGTAEGKGRREFLKSAAQVAVTAPAVAMLLSATTKSAVAQSAYGNTACQIGTGDGNDGGDHGGLHDTGDNNPSCAS